MKTLKIAKMNFLANENFLLAEKLRQEDPDQFYTLVKMHLSFVLDLNTEECENSSEKKYKALKWSLPFIKKQKYYQKNCNEGALLTSEFIDQMHLIIQFLSEEENISQEGIFRRSGRVTRQQELKQLLHQGAELNLSKGQFSVHECATVLKNVLSELPESVLTDAHYPAYCQIAELCGGKNPASQDRLLRSIQLLILLLPFENRKFFQKIIQLLHLAISHQDKNRMSAENLATLFTPHLLCPRKLSPEALHVNSQVMSRVVAFMIEKGSELFDIPPTVATDVKAYWDKKERRKLSPLKQMNESVCDGTAANTVYSFVDRERTAQENQTNPTETALAQLYAYIQSLPESSKKRKLIKQFNKENGYGTPLTVSGKKRTKALNLGGSIKKHLSGFSKTNKRTGHQEGIGEVTSPEPENYSKKSSSDNCEKVLKENRLPTKLSISSENSTVYYKKPLPKTDALITSFENDIYPSFRQSFKCSNKSCENLGNYAKPYKKDEISCNSVDSLSLSQTSPGQNIKFPKKRSSFSPINISPSKSIRISDEHITPSVLPVGKENQTWTVSNQCQQISQTFYKFNVTKNLYGSAQNLSSKENELFKGKELVFNELCKTPRRAMSDFYLCENISQSDADNPTKNLLKINTPIFVRNTNNNGFLSTPNNTNRLPIFCGPKTSLLMTTSTPAPGNGCLITPIVDKNNSMSPITKSTRRMPKAMQETMMTPRSRKPVISLSNTDLCNLTNGDSLSEDDSYDSQPKLPLGKRLLLEDSNEDTGNDSLSSTFRNYLFSRSVLTASPVDLSFSSRTDDFLSISDKSSSESNENFKTLPEILHESGLSESLLYCLDGNDPTSDPGTNNDEAKLAHCTCSFSDCEENSHHVYETAL